MAPGGRDERILLTGGGGFVGGHVRAALAAAAPEAQVVAPPAGPAGLDLQDRAGVEACVRDLRPTAILHLAAISDVAAARRDPWAAWDVNLGGTIALGLAALTHAPDCRFVYAGTGEVYGLSFRSAPDPLTEAAPLAPANAYAASKAAADLALGQLALDGLRATRFRPFNHTGPGQSERFVTPAFAAQIARIEAGLAPPVLRVGDLTAERDFIDVRDVVRAYLTVLLGSVSPAPGAVFNLASGRARRIGDMLDTLRAMSRVAVAVEQDPARMRPSDTPRALGDAGAARVALGWAPAIPWETTLADTLGDWRTRVAAGRGQATF